MVFFLRLSQDLRHFQPSPPSLQDHAVIWKMRNIYVILVVWTYSSQPLREGWLWQSRHCEPMNHQRDQDKNVLCTLIQRSSMFCGCQIHCYVFSCDFAQRQLPWPWTHVLEYSQNSHFFDICQKYFHLEFWVQSITGEKGFPNLNFAKWNGAVWWLVWVSQRGGWLVWSKMAGLLLPCSAVRTETRQMLGSAQSTQVTPQPGKRA